MQWPVGMCECYNDITIMWYAARFVTGTRKFDRGLGQILYEELHWIDVPDRVIFKLAVKVHRKFTGVWTAAHHRNCRITSPLSPVLIGGICVPPTVNCSQYLVTGSTLTAVWPCQLPAPQSGTLSRISSRTRPSVWTVSDGCLKRICSLDTSDFSALEVLTTTALYKFTYLLYVLLEFSAVWNINTSMNTNWRTVSVVVCWFISRV